MTNDAWFGRTIEPWEHLALAQFRASSTGATSCARPTAACGIIDPVGRVMVHSTPFTQATGDAIVHIMKESTTYEILGDAPVWLITLAALAGAFIKRKSKSKELTRAGA